MSGRRRTSGPNYTMPNRRGYNRVASYSGSRGYEGYSSSIVSDILFSVWGVLKLILECVVTLVIGADAEFDPDVDGISPDTNMIIWQLAGVLAGIAFYTKMDFLIWNHAPYFGMFLHPLAVKLYRRGGYDYYPERTQRRVSDRRGSEIRGMRMTDGVPCGGAAVLFFLIILVLWEFVFDIGDWTCYFLTILFIIRTSVQVFLEYIARSTSRTEFYYAPDPHQMARSLLCCGLLQHLISMFTSSLTGSGGVGYFFLVMSLVATSEVRAYGIGKYGGNVCLVPIAAAAIDELGMYGVFYPGDYVERDRRQVWGGGYATTDSLDWLYSNLPGIYDFLEALSDLIEFYTFPYCDIHTINYVGPMFFIGMPLYFYPGPGGVRSAFLLVGIIAVFITIRDLLIRRSLLPIQDWRKTWNLIAFWLLFNTWNLIKRFPYLNNLLSRISNKYVLVETMVFLFLLAWYGNGSRNVGFDVRNGYRSEYDEDGLAFRVMWLWLGRYID